MLAADNILCMAYRELDGVMKLDPAEGDAIVHLWVGGR